MEKWLKVNYEARFSVSIVFLNQSQFFGTTKSRIRCLPITFFEIPRMILSLQGSSIHDFFFSLKFAFSGFAITWKSNILRQMLTGPSWIWDLFWIPSRLIGLFSRWHGCFFSSMTESRATTFVFQPSNQEKMWQSERRIAIHLFIFRQKQQMGAHSDKYPAL